MREYGRQSSVVGRQSSVIRLPLYVLFGYLYRGGDGGSHYDGVGAGVEGGVGLGGGVDSAFADDGGGGGFRKAAYEFQVWPLLKFISGVECVAAHRGCDQVGSGFRGRKAFLVGR